MAVPEATADCALRSQQRTGSGATWPLACFLSTLIYLVGVALAEQMRLGDEKEET